MLTLNASYSNARRLIERITVDDDHFTVEFKSGLETVVEA